MKRSIAIAIACACLVYAAGASASKSGVVKLFQEAMDDETVPVSGVYDEPTKAAMQALQAGNGMDVTEYPDGSVLALLHVPASVWKSIVEASGAPEEEVEEADRASKKVIADSLATSMKDTFADPGSDR